MNKKLMAVAVAGALAVPGVALAQSSVTISGFFKVSLDQINFNGATLGPAGGALAPGAVGGGRYGNTSESRVTDNSSRLIFNVNEDLGNGLAAVAQLDIRFNPPSAENVASSQFSNITAGGNTWVGLESKSWGRVALGKFDLHYGKSGDAVATPAAALQSNAISLFDNVARPVAAVAGTTNTPATTSQAAIANTTRTNNVVRWDSPNWSGFNALVAYTTNPLAGMGGDLGTTTLAGSGAAGAGGNVGQVITRKGYGWNAAVKYTASVWGAEYSHWDAKADVNNTSVAFAAPANAAVAVADDQKSDVLAGYFTWNNFRAGLAWNRGKTTSPTSGLVTGDRDAWAIPVSYTMGPHVFGYTYTKTNNSKDVTSPANGATISGSGTGATMNTLVYQYNMSKRTALSLTFSQIQNKEAAAYTFFTGGPTSLGSTNSNALAGERLRLLSATVMHSF